VKVGRVGRHYLAQLQNKLNIKEFVGGREMEFPFKNFYGKRSRTKAWQAMLGGKNGARKSQLNPGRRETRDPSGNLFRGEHHMIEKDGN